MKILFMGTPEFAAVSLERLLKESDFEIAVVTQPDKPQGRHMALVSSEVKKVALRENLPLYQPDTLKNGAFEEELKAIDPDLIAVVAYGKILPEYILNYPKFGCINLHGSLLPAYRGAAPMQRMVMDGVKEYGVTTMYVEKGLDTGDMLEVFKTSLRDEDNFETVHDTLAVNGAELLLSTIRKAEKGTLRPIKQNAALATYAAKIEKEDCKLNFARSARELHNHVRGLSPMPLAFCFLRGKVLKIIKTVIVAESGDFGAPGTVKEIAKDGVVVACGIGAIKILTLKPEGKGMMDAAAFARGRGIALGDRLE